MTKVRAQLILLVIVATYAMFTVAAMRKTSTTFDEIVMIAGGARGYESGDWLLAPEHPPITQYVYGLLPYLAGLQYPDESGVTDGVRRHMGYRYNYAQQLFYGEGNDPEQLALLGRIPAVLFGIALILAVFAFGLRSFGPAAGLLGATIVAFTPDVLAHGGVAYNDIAVTFAFFLAMWRLDAAIRSPTFANAALAGLTSGIALGIKNSAVGLALLAVLILAAEAMTRWRDVQWRKRALSAALVTVAATYVTLVFIYRGDLTLIEYRYALSFVFQQVATSGAPAYLLGNTSPGGIWYYFPVAFLFKTSVAYQLLLLLALAFMATRVRSFRQLLDHPLRAPALAALVIALMLARSQLQIGFRYALPILPMIAVITAAVTVRVASRNWLRMRPVIIGAVIWIVIHPLTYFPNFLAYMNEYGPSRDRAYQVFADSSLDWGQGLIQLREFMRERNIDRIYLSYFGSAWPSGYGIDYEPLPSFFPLPASPRKASAPPTHVAISATNLTGAYFGGSDPYRAFRERPPEAVIGHTIFVYRVQE